MRRILIISFFSFILQACDCVQATYGVVVDEKSLKPLDGVLISNEAKRYAGGDYTSVDGSFTVRDISGGLLGCPDLELKFKKLGYEELVVEMESKSSQEEDSIQYVSADTIKLKRLAE